MWGRGTVVGLVVGVVAAATLALTGAATGARVEGAVIGTGKLRGIYWGVEAFPDENRKGICFVLAYGNRDRPNSEDGRCSAPAEKRGIFLPLESDHRHAKHGAITVVGMALNAVVAKVKVTTCSGQVETLHPKKPHGPGSGLGHIADYRYIAYAVRGPWCADIVTYNAAGEALFESSASPN
jgi:hypothetical protein